MKTTRYHQLLFLLILIALMRVFQTAANWFFMCFNLKLFVHLIILITACVPRIHFHSFLRTQFSQHSALLNLNTRKNGPNCWIKVESNDLSSVPNRRELTIFQNLISKNYKPLNIFLKIKTNKNKTFCTVPSAPSNLDVNIVNNTADATWTSVTGADKYLINLYEILRNSSRKRVVVRSVVNPSTFFTGLLYGTRYVAQICSVNRAGETCVDLDFETGQC